MNSFNDKCPRCGHRDQLIYDSGNKAMGCEVCYFEKTGKHYYNRNFDVKKWVDELISSGEFKKFRSEIEKIHNKEK